MCHWDENNGYGNLKVTKRPPVTSVTSPYRGGTRVAIVGLLTTLVPLHV